MGKSTCSTPDCTKPVRRGEWCSNHHRHALESGETGRRVPCKWIECGKYASTRGFCLNHYTRASRCGDFETPWLTIAALRSKTPCGWPDCESEAILARGMCRKHYLRAYKMGNFEDPWDHYRPYGVPEVIPECIWPGCDRPSKYAGYCARDYSRAKAVNDREAPWLKWDTSGTCEACGKSWEFTRNRSKRVCSNTCGAKLWALENPERSRSIKMDAVRRRRARMAGVEIEYFTVEDVRLAHGDDCYLCGKPINYRLKFPHPMSPSVDHVKPISAGGPHSLSNCAMTHMECNNKKNAGEATALPVSTLFTP